MHKKVRNLWLPKTPTVSAEMKATPSVRHSDTLLAQLVHLSFSFDPLQYYMWIRALIVAMWADRFSRYCWQRFSRFLVCPLTLPPVSASHCLSLHLCSMKSLLPSCCRGKGEGVGDISHLHAKQLRLQQLDCHWGEVLTESRPRLLLLRVVPLWLLLLMILVIAHWMRCSITYEIRISRRFSRQCPIDRSPNVNFM